MNPLLKQRLVGALVLVALGVVFWPLIFVTPETREPLVLRTMSERPTVDQTPIAEPESYESKVAPSLPAAPDNSQAAQDAADASTQTNAQLATLTSLPSRESVAAPQPRAAPPPDESLIDDEGMGIFYVLQVATVGSELRADEIVEGLRARGFKAFAKRYVRADDELFRVQIGPNAERAVLLQMKPDIDQALRVDSQILRYAQ